MSEKEAAVKAAAFILKHPAGHVNSCSPEYLYASACHLGKRIDTAYHYTPETAFRKQPRTGRGLAEMSARLKSNINGAFPQVGASCPGRGHGIDLGMRPAPTPMPAFARYQARNVSYHSPHHGIGRSETPSESGESQSPPHHEYIVFISIHRRKNSINASITQHNFAQKTFFSNFVA